MKKLSIVVFVLALSFSAMSQDKKATKGAFGLGFGLNFVSNVSPNVSVQYMVTDQVEIGTPLWVTWNHTRNSTFDTAYDVYIVNTNTRISSERENKFTTSMVTFGIAPFFKYHFKTKNNLDVYTGVNVPVGISTTQKTVTSTTIEADDFHMMSSTTTTGPINVGVGAGVLLGCRWFFYENFALGVETNLGFLATLGNGKNKTVSHMENTGANNPASTLPAVDDVTTEAKVKNTTMNLGLMKSIGFSLTYYFGGKKKTE